MSGMLVVTTPTVPGYRVVKVLGLVHATSVRTRGLGGQFAAALESLIGGEVSS
ncbi:MAG TPA: heavy metal-binding domain-containing protein, partial [Candidatus Korarchaeota archaeon]|nr:heavy metal-binding domain-containing protein [Candidatus Korarchaeota archaeon]